MSEVKSFEEIFLSENKTLNLQKSELDILLVSDIHLSFNYLERLKEWTVENKRLFDYIFCTGDFLKLNYPENEDNVLQAEGETKLSAIISYLENICLNVIYLGGNHDTKSLFETKDTPTLTIKSLNLHKKILKVTNDLYFLGLGGSIHTNESSLKISDPLFTPYQDLSDKIRWIGYPYNIGASNFKESDEKFGEDLASLWQKTQSLIEETNTTKNIKFILLTHIGPFYSNTTKSYPKDGKCVYMGSIKLQDFLNQNPDVFMNIHGHSHDALGRQSFSHFNVINPGSLQNGNFGVLKLKRDFSDEWLIANTEFIKLL
jgi:Icc-related predicted phosphoesterase